MYRYRLAGVLLIGAFLATSVQAQFAPQQSTQGGVTVAVTPEQFGKTDPLWTFRIALDTHSQDLSDDLLQSASLVDGSGRESKPVAWDGAAPGGHHRGGVLKFKAIDPPPTQIELRITRAGETTARTFRWEMK